MTDLLITATLEDSNGFTDDSVITSFAFRSAMQDPLQAADNLNPAVISFFNDVAAPAVAPISSFLSSQIDRSAGACTIRAYDITGKLGYLEPGDEGFVIGKKRLHPMGSPIDEDSFTLGPAAQPDNLPPQIANVITLRSRNALQAAVEGPGDIRPKQRLTGRIYVGKLNNRAAVPGSAAAGNFPRPDGDFQTACLEASEKLALTAEGVQAVWCVWSRTAGQLHGITSVEVDDSWDVLRSRKTKPTVRVKNVFANVPDVVLGA